MGYILYVHNLVIEVDHVHSHDYLKLVRERVVFSDTHLAEEFRNLLIDSQEVPGAEDRLPVVGGNHRHGPVG